MNTKGQLYDIGAGRGGNKEALAPLCTFKVLFECHWLQGCSSSLTLYNIQTYTCPLMSKEKHLKDMRTTLNKMSKKVEAHLLRVDTH